MCLTIFGFSIESDVILMLSDNETGHNEVESEGQENQIRSLECCQMFTDVYGWPGSFGRIGIGQTRGKARKVSGEVKGQK
jgi:hypothetical protein